MKIKKCNNQAERRLAKTAETAKTQRSKQKKNVSV